VMNTPFIEYKGWTYILGEESEEKISTPQ